MSEVKVIDSALDSGVDRKTLKLIKKRFSQVNNARLARTKSALTPRQQIFLELLPMLFHVNHPILPGYISHQTPCGLAGYNPKKYDVQKVQRLARSFTYRRLLNVKRNIHGIFLMGSCGTIAQSESSDLDIWVCHPSTLSSEEKLQLRQKTDDISRWALSTGLEAHFFLMEDEKFRHGERENLSSEDCGSTQHYLLLDEFYRTGLLIAGRIPIWWLIPADEEQQYEYYANTLRKKRFVGHQDTLDFGGVGHIPAGEFVGAGVWQLYKAIDSPYKSVLKILLTEVYAAEYPNIEPLSTHFKRAIYNDQLDIDELDPYVVVYRKLEHYLLDRNELSRLELVRRCFYFKVGKALTRPSRTTSKSWQRQLMEKLVNQWQWSREHLHNLDSRNKWKVTRVMDEQKELVRELTNSYRFVLEFARRTKTSAMINSQEMTILGRKLYAAFERKAGKIEWINPGIAANLAEESLTFYQIDNPLHSSKTWAVTDEPLDIINTTDDIQPLKRSDELISLVGWCHFNGLLDNATRAAVIDGEHAVTDYELQRIIHCLRQRLPIAKQYSEQGEETHNRFEQTMHPIHLLLFINVGIDPLAAIRSQGIERLSAQTDSLGFSGLKENLALNVEQIIVNSWGELNSRRYDNEHALIRCLRDYLMMLPPNSGPLPQLSILCFCPTRANAIASRVEQLFRDVAACYHNAAQPLHTRYVIEIQREYFVLQFDRNNHPLIKLANNYSTLIEYLSQPQSHYSPIVLDQYCLQNSVLAAISRYAQRDIIQVFYQIQGNTACIYLLDEMGSLFQFDTPFYDQYSLLTPLDQFIQSTLFRRSSEQNDIHNEFPAEFNLHNFTIEYFEITESPTMAQISRRNNIVGNISSHHFLQVQVIGNQVMDGNVLWTIYCDQQEFSELELGDELYSSVAKYILSRRNMKERYPCYITDLDLSRCIDETSVNPVQTVYFLRYKQKLEQYINQALQTL